MSKRCVDTALEHFRGRAKTIGRIREGIIEKVIFQWISKIGHIYIKDRAYYTEGIYRAKIHQFIS